LSRAPLGILDRKSTIPEISGGNCWNFEDSQISITTFTLVLIFFVKNLSFRNLLFTGLGAKPPEVDGLLMKLLTKPVDLATCNICVAR